MAQAVDIDPHLPLKEKITMTRAKNNVLAAVVRVSQVGGRSGESFRSPSQQIEVMRAAAERLGYTIRVFGADAEGQGVSGSVPFDLRPGMGEALRLVDDGELAGVIVSALDRLVREDPEKGVTLKSFQRRIKQARGVLVVCDNPDACIDDPDDEELTGNAGIGLGARLLFDRAYREEAGKKLKVSQRDAVAAGVWIPPTVPAGMRRKADNPDYPKELLGSSDAKSLEIDPVHGPVVRDAFKMKADGAGNTEIGRYLDAHGVHPPKVENWSSAAVAYLLKNKSECYRGVNQFGPYRKDNAWPALIESGLWYRVQDQIKQGGRGERKERKRNPESDLDRAWATGGGPTFLRGLCRCSSCGSPLVRNTVTKVRNGKKFQYHQLSCSSKDKRVCAASATISRQPLEAFVVQELLKRASIRVVDEEVARTPEYERLESEVEKAEGKLAEAIAAFGESGLSPAVEGQIVAKLEGDRDAAVAALNAVAPTVKEVDTAAWILEWMLQEEDAHRDAEGNPTEVTAERVLQAVEAIQSGTATSEDEAAWAEFLTFAHPDALRAAIKQHFAEIVVSPAGKSGSRKTVAERVTIVEREDAEGVVSVAFPHGDQAAADAATDAFTDETKGGQ